MRNIASLLAILAIGALASGCANTEQKFGRGTDNFFEILRFGEFRRTVEQTAVLESPDVGYTTGVVRGFNRTLARTGMGIYEMVTAPIPPYGPIFTDHFAPNPVYPDSYIPRRLEDSLFATDSTMGFSGGDVLPIFPGSRFHVFEGP